MSIKTWTDEQEEELIRLYTSEEEIDPMKLATHFDKGHRSVISKLVQLKIYIKPESRQEEKPLSVKAMLFEVERILDIKLNGYNLNKKDNLTNIVNSLRELVGDNE